MDDFSVDAFVNRDDPIPVISFGPRDEISEEETAAEVERKRDALKRHGKNIKDNFISTGTSMQDRLLEK